MPTTYNLWGRLLRKHNVSGTFSQLFFTSIRSIYVRHVHVTRALHVGIIRPYCHFYYIVVLEYLFSVLPYYICSYLLSLVCRHFFNEKGRKASFTTTKRNEGAAYLRYGLCESTYTLVLYIYYLAFKMYACRALKPFNV